MNNLTVTEYKNTRVLTTQQIAAVYETDTKIISNNFNRNKERYHEGKHFILLEGADKMEFLNHHQYDDGSKKAKLLYLWTEKGAFLHAKSLNTDVAWEVYDKLVDSYFAKQTPSQPLPTNLSPQLQLLINLELKQKEHDQKIHELEDKAEKQSEALRTIKETLLSKMEGEGYNKGVIKSIKSIAQSEYFADHAYRYQGVWSESYKRLTEKAGCNLNTLVSNAKKRAAESGATKAQISKICKLSVIASDKKLRELYSAVLKEMLAIYCMEVA